MTGDVQVPDGGGDPADFGGVHTPGMSDDERRLDEVWRAFGCASNPDAFKASVRERMWARVCEMARAAEARDTRLDRENRDLRAALASQPAPTVTDEAVEAFRTAHRRSWMEHAAATLDERIRIALTAALPHLTPAQSGDGVAEVAWDDGHRHGYSDGYDDNGNGCDGQPAGNPYRIVRTTTEETP